MQYELSFDSFTEIPFTSGTIQNINSQATVEVSTTDTPNTGIILYPGEKYEWSDATIYARAAWGNGETVMVAAETLVAGSGGGGGGSYTLPIATKTVLGGVKSSDTVGKISVDNFGVMTYNAPDAQPLEAPEWAENTAYVVNALVEHNDDVYMCLVAHTSTSDFDADLAGGKWKLVGLALKVATTTQLGGVKANDADGGVSVASDGVMTINLPTASTTTKGGVKVGTGVEVDANQKLNVTKATASVIGGVKSSTDDGKVSVGTDGTMSVNGDIYVKHVETQDTAYMSLIDVKKSGLEKGVNPDSNTGMNINLRDKNNNVLGLVYALIDPNGNSVVSIEARNFKGDGYTSASIHYDADGKTFLSIPTPELSNQTSKAVNGRWFCENGHYHNAASHNAHYRGKDLTAYMESGDMSTAIANGSFTDIFPGDYVTKSVTIDGTTYSNIKWVVMDLDYFRNTGDNHITTHHVVLMPETILFGNVVMNDTATTVGGYKGSKMWTTTIPLIDAGIEVAFGSSHVLSHRELLTITVDTSVVSSGFGGYTGASSACEWSDVKSNIPNEPMVYGCHPCSSSLNDVLFTSQFAAFKYNPSLMKSGIKSFWLRAVAYSTSFAVLNADGYASWTQANNSLSYLGVRPYFLYY